jgi:pantoate--beta-alanine ligase
MTTVRDDLVVVEDVRALREAVADLRHEGAATVGFVPTMGALHDGHRRLLRAARERCDVVVASCYVNPTQFGAGEDLDRYPRTPEADERAVRECGAQVLWRPTDRDVYGGVEPADRVMVRVGRIGDVLEGASRPGHFDGVASVVVRLLGAVRPDELVLGRKDWQQVAVLRRVVDQLQLGVEVRVVPTVREEDGLALSSRNAYLDARAREAALAIPRALQAGTDAFAAGHAGREEVREAVRDVLAGEPRLDVDHVELVRAGTVEPAADRAEAGDAILVAATVAGTRLIDNAVLGEDGPLEGLR